MATEAAAPEVDMNGTSGQNGSGLSEDHRKRIVRQIEFYFSDANLPTDRFMFINTTPHLDANKAPTLSAEEKAKAVSYGPGCSPVLLSTICSFKRMRPYSSVHSLSVIADALKSSTTEPKLLEVFKDGEKWMIRRVKPMEETTRAGAAERSVYVKGFLPEPEEGGQADAPEPEGMQQKLEEWADGHGVVAALRMRRVDPVKKETARDGDAKMKEAEGEAEKKASAQKWKNSVFIEFQNIEDAKAMVEAGQREAGAEGKPTFEGRDLVVMSKVDYVTKKAHEKGFAVPDMSKNRGAPPTNGASSPSGAASRASGSANAGRRPPPFNAFRELTSIKNGSKTYIGQLEDRKKKAKEEAAKPITLEYDGKTYEVVRVGKDGGKLKDGQEFEAPKGMVLKFDLKGDAPEDFRESRVNFGKLKNDIGEASGLQCSFVDFTPGSSSGFLGFNSALTPDTLTQIKAKTVSAGGREVEFSSPTETEEKEYHQARLDHRIQLAVSPDSGSGGGGRGGRGGGRGGRGGRGGGRGGRGGGRSGDRNAERAEAQASAAKPPSSAAKKRDAEGNVIGGGAGGTTDSGPPEVGSVKKARVEPSEV